ncbi:hypothetical protein [Acaryochloris sp. IP29b_bin.137]|uniref:hypothetical protein n=1 Tax=Acaryochloris sp. IP29b_bin.137 TaxID=2969217 RepID=UPI00261E01EB|nr:hypothetical protein [Acaryochloris sp. IP29b_bin.137]
MSATTPTHPTVHSSISINERYILTQAGSWVLVFSARWVSEIFRVPRSRILALPFYQSPLMGVTHHNSHIIPLASAHHLLQTEENTLRETVTILKLSSAAGTLAHMGIVVDKTLGSSSQDQLPPAILTTPSRHPQDTNSMVLFQTDWFPPDLWHPQR